jgi:hypothetical protein
MIDLNNTVSDRVKDQVNTQVSKRTIMNEVRNERNELNAPSGYRLLEFGDKIEKHTQFLEDDAETWTEIDGDHRWMIGCEWQNHLKPMRVENRSSIRSSMESSKESST